MIKSLLLSTQAIPVIFRLCIRAFFIACLLASMPSAHADRIALVIGNSDYIASPLRNPRNDSRDIAATLEKLGFEVMLKTNVNRREFVRAIREFGERLKLGGTGLFYYAGHAIQSEGSNFLMPIKAEILNEADLDYEAINAGRGRDYM